jgi:hypothetical protein
MMSRWIIFSWPNAAACRTQESFPYQFDARPETTGTSTFGPVIAGRIMLAGRSSIRNQLAIHPEANSP